MLRVFVAETAADEIVSILAWSDKHFGEAARRRYDALILQAINDLAENPERPGVHVRTEIAESVRTYHLKNSRDRVPLAAGRVREPRHFLLFRVRADESLEIGRVLHDGMDIFKHVPDEFRS
jgi:toxin ParE1/3/4